MIDIPMNIEAEQALLGVLIGSPWLIDEVLPHVKSDDFFFRAQHRHLWAALVALRDKADEVTIAEHIRKQGALERCGGAEQVAAYVQELGWAMNQTLEWEPYLFLCRQAYHLRETLHCARELQRRAADPCADGAFVVAEFNRMASDLLERSAEALDVKPPDVLSAMRAEYQAGGTIGVTTGYRALDNIGGEFQYGGLYILAARPGQGKTALACNVYDRYLKAGIPCGMFALEMSAKQVFERMAGVRVGIDTRKLREGKLHPTDRDAAFAALEEIATGMMLCDRAGITVGEIAARARVWKRSHNIQAIFVDYLQIVRPDNRALDRHLQIGEMTKALKSLARELNIVVLAACQINREVEKRASTKPTLADLKESGSIEEDADGVIMIYREKDPDPSKPTWEAFIGWAKNRHGGVGHGKFTYERATTRFLEQDNTRVADDIRASIERAFDARAGKD